ncbi:hypothetical protein YC2023_001423 [Brassica napus]
MSGVRIPDYVIYCRLQEIQVLSLGESGLLNNYADYRGKNCKRSSTCARKTKATVDDDGGSELHQRSSRKTTNSTATEANKRPIAAQKQAAEGKQLGPAICETIGVVEFSWCTCVRTDGVALCA